MSFLLRLLESPPTSGAQNGRDRAGPRVTTVTK
jgi:hypothetical protein